MPRAKSKVETALRQKGFAENQSHHHLLASPWGRGNP